MILLDTDILTHLHAGHPRVVDRLRSAVDSDVAITIVTKVELLRGRFEFLLKAANGHELTRAQFFLDRTEELLAQVAVVSFDAGAAEEFDRSRKTRWGGRMGRADLLIACIALKKRATLVTRNTADFRAVPGLRVENWMD